MKMSKPREKATSLVIRHKIRYWYKVQSVLLEVYGLNMSKIFPY